MSYSNETEQASGLPEFTENLSPIGGTASATVCHQQRK
uniref:Uncharacterized protein n=1 Tax=Setaria italica TaxID=4555 RepID=K4A093_SETIT